MAALAIYGKNIVLAGTSMVSGQAKALVFATGIHTEFGKIAHLTQTARTAVSPLGTDFIFGTAPVAGSVWRFLIPFAAGTLILEELRKRLARQKVG